jgi:hypothetical protein
VENVDVYFDESGSDDNSPVLCIAGYIIEKDAALSMDAEWLDVLEEFKLPFFRMSACAHGTYPFDRLSKDQRIEVGKEMIKIIKNRTLQGLAVTVEPKLFEEIMPAIPEVGTAYAFCAHACVAGVQWWANHNNFSGLVTYVFESGHGNQSEANQLVTRLSKIPQKRMQQRYSSHMFADKRKVRPLQAADLLAWQWFTDHKRKQKGIANRRQDCAALMEGGCPPHRVVHYDATLLRKMGERALGRRFPLTYTGPDPFSAM